MRPQCCLNSKCSIKIHNKTGNKTNQEPKERIKNKPGGSWMRRLWVILCCIIAIVTAMTWTMCGATSVSFLVITRLTPSSLGSTFFPRFKSFAELKKFKYCVEKFNFENALTVCHKDSSKLLCLFSACSSDMLGATDCSALDEVAAFFAFFRNFFATRSLLRLTAMTISAPNDLQRETGTGFT